MPQHLMIQHLMTSKGQNGNSLKCILFAIQSIGGYTVPPCFHQLPFQSPVSILFHNSLARLFEGHQFSVCSIPSFMINCSLKITLIIKYISTSNPSINLNYGCYLALWAIVPCGCPKAIVKKTTHDFPLKCLY